MSSNEIAETVFRLGRIQNNNDWLLPLVLFVLLLVFFVRRYRIDAAELKRTPRNILFFLRIAALCGLLLYYLHPQWEQFVGNSKIILLIDSSTSMGNRDTEDGKSRYAAALDWLAKSQFTEKLSQKHNVTVLSFSDTLQENIDDVSLQQKMPDGDSTAIGDVLFETLQRERGQPLAGIVMISDGGSNTGQSLEIPLETAQRLRIPMYPIGVGQTHPPLNYRVGTLNVPERVVPNDPFVLKVPLEMIGGTASTATVELMLNDTLIESKNVSFPTDGTVETSFDVRIAYAGQYRLIAQIIPPQEDHVPEDNRQQTEINAVERKDKVLLFASAPSRDYQFFCAQLFRDNTVSVDAYLPWAQDGISQSVDKILDEFPSTRSEMAEYDIVIAFDPDWRELSPEQIDHLEFWAARQGGGVILIAGHVFQADAITGWTADPGMDKVRALYPVEFWATQASFDHRFHSGVEPYPLKFTRAGENARFLQNDNEQEGSGNVWNRFAGYFGYFSVKGVKPAATLLATSSSPETRGKEESGALIVEQFYGAGHVLYFGSGELWRLRRVDEKAFEQIVTKIVRYIGQGRLQRESDRGTLTLDKQHYSLGSMAQLRLTANDPQLNPLTLTTLPVEVLSPSGTLRIIDASLDKNVPGLYLAYLPLDSEGTWTFQWQIPDSEQRIVRTAQVQMSDLERENPHRNEPLLQEIAKKSGGTYLSSFAAAESLPEKIEVRSQRAVVDEARQENGLYYLLLGICIVLLCEWTLRRFMRLA